MRPQTIRLSKAMWLTAFPHGPTETERIVKEHETRQLIDSMLPEAVSEWTAQGLDPRDLELFSSSHFRLEEAYKRVQGKPQPPAVLRVMATAAQQIRKNDDEWQKLCQAETDLNTAGHQGFIWFLGRPREQVLATLVPIDPTYFRFPRIFLAHLDCWNEIDADSVGDPAQKGHSDFVEVEVDFASFEQWMFHTGR